VLPPRESRESIANPAERGSLQEEEASSGIYRNLQAQLRKVEKDLFELRAVCPGGSATATAGGGGGGGGGGDLAALQQHVEGRIAETERWAHERFQGLEGTIDAVAVAAWPPGASNVRLNVVSPGGMGDELGQWAEQRFVGVEERIEAWGNQVGGPCGGGVGLPCGLTYVSGTAVTCASQVQGALQKLAEVSADHPTPRLSRLGVQMGLI